jgi:protein-S-isoprenylcysteine O-methyltransferase Ste14
VAKVVVFIAISVVLALLSRGSLGRPGSHGFFRFLAWESILGLTLLNFRGVDAWFGDSLSTFQLVSWFLLAVSLLLVIWGACLLRGAGKPDAAARDDTALLGFEKTTRLVTSGAFKYIRHPLYSSLLFLTWGVFFKRPSWIAAGLAVAATLCLTATAKVEESENIRYFGSEYRTYMNRTRMFVPFLF